MTAGGSSGSDATHTATYGGGGTPEQYDSSLRPKSSKSTNGSGLGDGIVTLAKNHGYTITSEEVYAHQDFLGQDGDLTDFELEMVSGGQNRGSGC